MYKYNTHTHIHIYTHTPCIRLLSRANVFGVHHVVLSVLGNISALSVAEERVLARFLKWKPLFHEGCDGRTGAFFAPRLDHPLLKPVAVAVVHLVWQCVARRHTQTIGAEMCQIESYDEYF